ncbi:hypothetical protein GCM10008957_28930 [Deinococcus ruber]|uniref:Recombinase family protein n=1 Tax=Deinococcus ruber TaxID=1848197 RepID=A0A918CBJ9_9DEIO|nr:hypothetical protein GCM10008957_28930 [Deinococcus ruber]
MTLPVQGKLLSHQKIQPSHLDALAVVYIRQSTLGQLQKHQESTRLQYALVEYAQSLGWPQERILVIDDDLGKSGSSAVGRPGFQRLVTEVGLGHVGLILGIEMSRLARSNRDWHQLLEVCALFKTLIADIDGLYNPNDDNDRLLLGLKGTMSEAELHILKNRLHEGKLSKARRGELHTRLPIGYVLAPDGRVELDPDEQVQHVVHLIFQKFEALGTLHAVLRYLVTHQLQMGVRLQSRADARLEWHRPNRATLQNLLHHPMYAGTYTYGRRQTDARRKQSSRPATGRVVMSMDAWHVCLRNQVPAYISWEQYQVNLAQLQANRNVAGQSGAARQGAALLAGLLVCGQCGRRMTIQAQSGRPSYACISNASNYAQPNCLHCASAALDAWVVSQLLEALSPVSLALSLEARQHLEQERELLRTHWTHQLQRAAYEVQRAQRQYQAVEPEHRLVARSLERAWEEALTAQRTVQEEYARVQQHQTHSLTAQEVEQISALAADLPTLWFASATTMPERKDMLRLVIDRVVVSSVQADERLQVDIHWVGGQVTRGTVTRPVARMTQLSYYGELKETVARLRREGRSAQQIADELNRLALRPAKRTAVWSADQVRGMLRDHGLSMTHVAGNGRQTKQEDHQGEWWTLTALAVTLGMPSVTLYNWLKHERIQGRQEGRRWWIWADEQEVSRLRTWRATTTAERAHDRWIERTTAEQGLTSKEVPYV